jgi:ribosomal protein S18 acetylase RimI-like enzyme
MTQAYPPVRLAPSQKDHAAQVLARAFQNDPMYRIVIPEDDKRAKKLLWLFGKVVYYSLLYGEVYATPALEGVVCWLPPGQTELTVGRMIRTGLPGIVLRFGWAAYRRFDDNLAYAGSLHQRYAPEPHWYLWAIGVEPSCQGKGIGGELIKPVLTSASAAGTPCYLETHNESNVHFYERHGFKVVSKGKVPKHSLQVWAMLREP